VASKAWLSRWRSFRLQLITKMKVNLPLGSIVVCHLFIWLELAVQVLTGFCSGCTSCLEKGTGPAATVQYSATWGHVGVSAKWGFIPFSGFIHYSNLHCNGWHQYQVISYKTLSLLLLVRQVQFVLWLCECLQHSGHCWRARAWILWTCRTTHHSSTGCM